MRASQEIGKLEIRVVGVTKMRQNYGFRWWDGCCVWYLLFEFRQPLDGVTSELEAVLDEDVIVLLGVFHLIFFTFGLFFVTWLFK